MLVFGGGLTAVGVDLVEGGDLPVGEKRPSGARIEEGAAGRQGEAPLAGERGVVGAVGGDLAPQAGERDRERGFGFAFRGEADAAGAIELVTDRGAEERGRLGRERFVDRRLDVDRLERRSDRVTQPVAGAAAQQQQGGEKDEETLHESRRA